MKNKKKVKKFIKPKRPEPFPYQRDGALMLDALDGVSLLADEMGLGKSGESLMYVRRNKNKLPVLIVCPAYMKLKWADEVRMWTDLIPSIISTTNIQKVIHNQFKEKPECVIINYEILEAWMPFLDLLQPGILICDETHYIGNREARRTIATQIVARTCGPRDEEDDDKQMIPHRIMISGTPLKNRPVELWPTLNILWPKKFGKFMAYAYRYCAPEATRWGLRCNGAENIDELHKRLKHLGMIRRLKKDVLPELPKKRISVFPIAIERKEYDNANNDFMNWLFKMTGGNAKKVSSAMNAEFIVKLGYLLRLAARLKMEQVYEWIDEFLRDTDEKLLVFGRHKAILEPLYAKYEDQAVIITGDVSMNARHQVVKDFQNNKKIRLFVGNMAAAGVGIDLTAASEVAFIETAWTPGEHAQALDRAHRIGQTERVNCTWFVAHKTVEEKLCTLVQEKEIVMKGVLDGTNAEFEFNIMEKLMSELLGGM